MGRRSQALIGYAAYRVAKPYLRRRLRRAARPLAFAAAGVAALVGGLVLRRRARSHGH